MKISTFSDRICRMLTKIPKGKVTTYKELAKALGTNAYRAVGNSLNKNKNPDKYPCYKVINSSGSVGGYAKGSRKKIILLKKDKIEIKNKKIDLHKYLHRF